MSNRPNYKAFIEGQHAHIRHAANTIELDDLEGQLVATPDGLRVIYRVAVYPGESVEVIGDPENGLYEWQIRRRDGSATDRSNLQYGQSAAALRDGLTHLLS